MHGYSIFADYDHSIYLDGSLQLIGKVSGLIRRKRKYGLGFHSHPYAKDPYTEALLQAIYSRITRTEAAVTVNDFASNGLPRNIGLVEGGLIVCDNHNEKAKKIMDEWFSAYMRGEAKRDQLYLPYVLYKMGIEIEDINTYKSNIRENGVTRMVMRHSGYQR